MIKPLKTNGDTEVLEPTTMAVSRLVLDKRVQSRVRMDDDRIKQYAEAWKNGDRFPPIIVYYDGETYWVAEGFHRVRAALAANVGEILADIRSGRICDAIWHSAGANAIHGLNRTNADKRRAVEMLIDEPAWANLSGRTIAGQCRVSQPFVQSIKRERKERQGSGDNGYHLGNGCPGENGQQKTIGKDGKEYPATKDRASTTSQSPPPTRTTAQANQTGTGRENKSPKQCQDAKTEPTGQCRVNGVLHPDPPCIASLRATGQVPPNTIFELTAACSCAREATS